MHNLFEYGDILNSPYEAFVFDTVIHDFPVHQHWRHRGCSRGASALASLYGSIIYVRRIYRSDLRQRSLSPQSRRYDCTIT